MLGSVGILDAVFTNDWRVVSVLFLLRFATARDATKATSSNFSRQILPPETDTMLGYLGRVYDNW